MDAHHDKLSRSLKSREDHLLARRWAPSAKVAIFDPHGHPQTDLHRQHRRYLEGFEVL